MDCEMYYIAIRVNITEVPVQSCPSISVFCRVVSFYLFWRLWPGMRLMKALDPYMMHLLGEITSQKAEPLEATHSTPWHYVIRTL